jgi:hypothetical protein
MSNGLKALKQLRMACDNDLQWRLGNIGGLGGYGFGKQLITLLEYQSILGLVP